MQTEKPPSHPPGHSFRTQVTLRNFVPLLFSGALHDLAYRPPRNLPILDLLRSCAILLVFVGHFPVTSKDHAVPVISMLPYWGWTGVDLFFVLSGILIGTQLWQELRATGQIQIPRFLVRRGLRIWPLYFSMALFVTVEALVLHRPASGLIWDVSFLSNYSTGLISGGWSLSSEEQFYILSPIGIYLLSRRLRPEWCWVFPAAGLLTLPILRAISAYDSPLTIVELRQKLYLPFHTHSDGLAMGLLIAWLAVFHRQRVLSTRFRALVSIAMLIGGVGLYAVSRVVFNFTSLALIYGAFAFFGMAVSSVPRVLNWHGFYVISRLSYGIYLNHFEILPRLEAVLKKWWPQDMGPLYWFWVLMCFVACTMFSALTFQLIEWPFLQIRARWLATLKERAARDRVGAPQSASISG